LSVIELEGGPAACDGIYSKIKYRLVGCGVGEKGRWVKEKAKIKGRKVRGRGRRSFRKGLAGWLGDSPRRLGKKPVSANQGLTPGNSRSFSGFVENK